MTRRTGTRRLSSIVFGVLIVGFNLPASVAAAPLTTRANVSSSEVQANAPGLPGTLAISATGRFIAFDSPATNLVPGDTNAAGDVFVRDTQLGVTERVSISSGGTQANDASGGAVAISGDGRFVVFASLASNLVGGGVGFGGDLLIRDRTAGTTSLVRRFEGRFFNWPVFTVAVSDHGRFVAWDQGVSGHSQLAFRKDRSSGVVTEVHVYGELEAGELLEGMTADGSRVLVSEGYPGGLWIHRFATGRNVRIDVNSAGVPANYRWPGRAALSADGHYVLFTSAATNLVAGDTNGRTDAFVRNRTLNRTSRVSGSAGHQANGASWAIGISHDGQYRLFESQATNLVSGDTNGVTDLFLRNSYTGTTKRCSVDTNGDQANARAVGGALARQGRWSIWHTAATNLEPADTNGLADIYLHGPGC